MRATPALRRHKSPHPRSTGCRHRQLPPSQRSHRARSHQRTGRPRVFCALSDAGSTRGTAMPRDSCDPTGPGRTHGTGKPRGCCGPSGPGRSRDMAGLPWSQRSRTRPRYTDTVRLGRSRILHGSRRHPRPRATAGFQRSHRFRPRRQLDTTARLQRCERSRPLRGSSRSGGDRDPRGCGRPRHPRGIGGPWCTWSALRRAPPQTQAPPRSATWGSSTPGHRRRRRLRVRRARATAWGFRSTRPSGAPGLRGGLSGPMPPCRRLPGYRGSSAPGLSGVQKPQDPVAASGFATTPSRTAAP